MNVYAATDIGCKRSVNQDYYFASTDPIGQLPNLFLVADGMGGHNAGDFASRFITEHLVQEIKEDKECNPIKVIHKAVDQVNRELILEAEANEELKGMGTTLVLTTVIDDYMYVANVGDSRLYVIGEEIRQITQDHSLVQEMVRLGEINQEQARNHPDKNIITRAIGAYTDVLIDFFDMKLEQNDIVLLCSDGLTNMVTDEYIREIVTGSGTLEEKGNSLIQAANENGGKDNITILLVEPFAEEVKS